MFWDLLDTQAADEIRKHSAARQFNPGDRLVCEEASPGLVFFVQSGWVEVTRRGANGAIAILDFRGPGDIVKNLPGAMRRAQSITAKARTPVEAQGMAGEELLQLARDVPDIGQALLRTMADRLQDADRRDAQRHGSGALGAIADRLLGLHIKGCGHRLVVAQEEIARWAGVSLPSTSRALHILRQAGIIRTHRQNIIVLDESALAVVVRSGHLPPA